MFHQASVVSALSSLPRLEIQRLLRDEEVPKSGAYGESTQDPAGCFLNQFEKSVANRGGKAPAGWQWDPSDFWIEECGRVMEKPSFPVPAGRHLVTGGRQTTTVLTIEAPDSSGKQGWSLENGTLFDVTHLPCRSARYTPTGGKASDANELDFPVKPGAEMPPIPGCQKQDYAVLFVLAVDRDSTW